MEAAGSARERLLDAAARLFADRGIAGVGLRAITAEARVNIAAVNYHFGSKEGLLEALFERRAKPIADERLRLLDACVTGRGRPPILEQLLEAFLRPAFILGTKPDRDGAAFVRLRARMAIETESTAQRILSRAFDASSMRFMEALIVALPELAREQVEWRFHFLLGTMAYTMANNGRVQSLTAGRCDPGDHEAALNHLVPFLAAGFRSPASKGGLPGGGQKAKSGHQREDQAAETTHGELPARAGTSRSQSS